LQQNTKATIVGCLFGSVGVAFRSNHICSDTDIPGEIEFSSGGVAIRNKQLDLIHVSNGTNKVSLFLPVGVIADKKHNSVVVRPESKKNKNKNKQGTLEGSDIDEKLPLGYGYFCSEEEVDGKLLDDTRVEKYV
jgi:hypothetical protein